MYLAIVGSWLVFQRITYGAELRAADSTATTVGHDPLLPPVTNASSAADAVGVLANYDFRSPSNIRYLYQSIGRLRDTTPIQRQAELRKLDEAESQLSFACVTTRSWKGSDDDIVKSLKAECLRHWDALVTRRLKANPNDVDAMRAAVTYYGVIGDKSSQQKWRAQLVAREPESLDSIRHSIVDAISKGNRNEAAAGMLRYCESPLVDPMTLRGTLEWFISDGLRVGLDLSGMRPLVDKLPSGDELEWYMNVGSKLRKTDPSVVNQVKEARQVRSAFIDALKQTVSKNKPRGQ